MNTLEFISDATPVAMLTLGQLKEALQPQQVAQPQPVPAPQPVYKYGIRGIRELFNVSHATAQRYKNTFLKPAIKQNGQKIIIDVAKALELFDAK